MGTLTDQRPRMETSFSETYAICNEIEYVMASYGFTFEQAIEVVKLSVQITDYDVKDEQLAGFGELLQQVVDALQYNWFTSQPTVEEEVG